MADLTTSVLKAISIIADKSIEEVSSNKTIKATIKKVISTSEGKYLVNYNNGDFYVYTQPGNTNIYEIGEQIYVLIPEGDMSQKKFVLDRVNGDNDNRFSSKSLNSSLLNDYVMLGDNAVIENEYTIEGQVPVQRMQPLSLDSVGVGDFYYCYLRDPSIVDGLPKENDEYIYNTSKYPTISIDEEVFSNSAKQAQALLIRAKFKASLDMDKIGNYGIIVNIAFADETNPQTDDDGNITYPPKLISYVLDTNKMTGNPMKFYDYTSQYAIAEFNGENYLYVDSIIAFCEGFASQENEDDDFHVYIDDFEIVALDDVSAINGDYKLKLTTPQGNTVKMGERNNLEIIATTTYLNQDVTKNTSFYWGIKDPSITSTSDSYSIKLGAGYRYIETSKDTSRLVLTPADLTAAENVYICVGIYEADIILRTTISLYNNNNKLDITIDSDQGTSFQFNEGSPTLTCLINGKTSGYQENYPDEAFSFIWTKEDSEFGSILLNTTKARLEQDKQQELDECAKNGMSSAGRTVTQVLSYYSTRETQLEDISYPEGIFAPKIKCKLKNTNTYVTYSCSVYRGGVYIGYGTITLQNSKNIINNNYYVTITNGTQVFQYDEAGVAPDSQRKQNPTEVLSLTAVFYNPRGIEVTPKRVRWMLPEGKTLIDIPSIGLETDTNGAKYFVGDIFPLAIKETYDNTCNNNQLTVIVTHADGSEYRQTTNLFFTKVGEVGTNGTDTVVKINEPTNVPKDECLTIIKSNGKVFYNNGSSEDDLILEADLYTNNSQVLGYSTNWNIAGTSKKQAYNYNIESNNNACAIHYNGNDNELDTRIIKTEINLNGKYFYSFYGMPAIEYKDNYTYEDYPVKIMRDGTLKNVLYSSGGTNPTYDETQGAHIELDNWNETGYVNWRVESGPKEDTGYENPNLLLAISPKSKKGAEELTIDSAMEDIRFAILKARDTGEICKENASPSVKNYIRDFLVDVEKIGVDGLLPSSAKLSALWNRLAVFNNADNIPDKENTYIKTVYQEYYALFKQMQDEYDACRDINKEATKIYDKVQSVWRSEWPTAITEKRLSTRASSGITSIQELVNKYQRAYDNRSNEDAEDMPSRLDVKDSNGNIITPGIFKTDSRFLTLLGDSENYDKGLDKYYEDYFDSFGQVSQPHAILIEYGKILTAYLNLLVEEAQDCFDGEYSYKDNKNRTVNLYQVIKHKYDLAYSDWDTKTESGRQAIGQSIYDSIVSANGEIAGIYDNIRSLYKYYQKLYLNVKKYQVAEESNTLNAWSAMLNGQDPNLLNQIYIIPSENFNGLYMNNNVVGEIFTKTNNTDTIIATVYIPIIMTLNTYELASLNGWDGTSVEVGDDHILTPQVGAGVKDSTTNTFTGMVMGVVGQQASNKSSFAQKKTEKVGLIGYSNGRQSVFIDSETGRASFGLPEDDTNTEEGTNEGRIELVPGGVSKIGNWKIGNRFLYNIIDGSYERRKDEDSRSSILKNRLMIPHDKHGIILSSDQPYIHIKGEVYDDNNLNGINYEDEYNNINPGDSLELRMDPGNKSLFSIVQHTAGFGDEDIEDLLFGYKSSRSDNITTIVKSYVANQNTDESIQSGVGAEYYIYRLATDGEGKYKPYYKQEQISNFVKQYPGLWMSNADVYSNNISLAEALTAGNFKKRTGDAPVFSVDNDTGIITYNPNNLVWTNQATGLSNGDGWQSVTGGISSADKFSITFNYSKNINTPMVKDIQIGQIRNNSIYQIPKVKISQCTLNRVLSGINLDDSAENYIQFYIVSSQSKTIDAALLISREISFWDNQSNIDIELFPATAEQSLTTNSTFYLKARVYISSYAIDSNCSCDVQSKIVSTYKAPPTPPYGTIEIPGMATQNFTTSGGSISRLTGNYQVISTGSSQCSIQFSTGSQEQNNSPYGVISGTDSSTYDFILWKKNRILEAGRVTSGQGVARFFTTTATEWDSLGSNKRINSKPTASDPWYLSFYPEGYCTTKIVRQVETSTENSGESDTAGTLNSTASISISRDPSSNPSSEDSENRNLFIFTEDSSEEISGEKDSTEGGTVVNTIMVIEYKLTDSSVITLVDRNAYEINWGNWNTDNNYNSAKANISLRIANSTFGTLSALIPEDSDSLCIEEDSGGIGLQGIPYSRTFWEEVDGKVTQKVTIFKEYYNWINSLTDHSGRTQYGYIDIAYDKNICHKYIKTLKKNIVTNWFEEVLLPRGFSGGDKINNVWSWITIPVTNSAFMDSLYWKEFIRIGIDENGRFFSAGWQDKRTYSRTGRIYSFGKVPNLYGQEIRTQTYSNNYAPIMKIFTEGTNLKTTYITQGQKDDGNISIKTADSGYIELVASERASNENNTIPEGDSSFKVSYKTGVEIQTNNGNSKINFTPKDQLTIETGMVSVSVKDKNNIPRISYRLSDDGYSWINSPFYVVSSLSSATTGKSAISAALSDSDYRISANTEVVSEDASEKTPAIIQLQVGQNKCGLDILSTTSTLKSTKNRFITFDTAKDGTVGLLKVEGAELGVDYSSNNRTTTLNLKNSSALIQINKNSILLYSNNNNNNKIGIEIKTDGVKVQGGGLTVEKSTATSIFKGGLQAQGTLYAANTIYVGYTSSGSKSQAGSIRLYKDSNTSHYVTINAESIKQIFDWYNQQRWMIGCSGNTVFLRSVGNTNNPNGSYDSKTKTYVWKYNKTFKGYGGTW